MYVCVYVYWIYSKYLLFVYILHKVAKSKAKLRLLSNEKEMGFLERTVNVVAGVRTLGFWAGAKALPGWLSAARAPSAAALSSNAGSPQLFYTE